jgi:hypothetical protein
MVALQVDANSWKLRFRSKIHPPFYPHGLWCTTNIVIEALADLSFPNRFQDRHTCVRRPLLLGLAKPRCHVASEAERGYVQPCTKGCSLALMTHSARKATSIQLYAIGTFCGQRSTHICESSVPKLFEKLLVLQI